MKKTNFLFVLVVSMIIVFISPRLSAEQVNDSNDTSEVIFASYNGDIVNNNFLYESATPDGAKGEYEKGFEISLGIADKDYDSFEYWFVNIDGEIQRFEEHDLQLKLTEDHYVIEAFFTYNPDEHEQENELLPVWYFGDDQEYSFNTIQEAIDAAPEGTNIYVQAGTYNENIIINKDGISLDGSDDDGEVIIKADASDKPAVTIQADDVSFYSLVFEDSPKAIKSSGQTDNIFISSNHFRLTGEFTGETYNQINLTGNLLDVSELSFEGFENVQFNNNMGVQLKTDSLNMRNNEFDGLDQAVYLEPINQNIDFYDAQIYILDNSFNNGNIGFKYENEHELQRSQFYIERNHFTNLNQGLIIKDSDVGSPWVTNNKFLNNKSGIVISHLSDKYGDYNISNNEFKDNQFGILIDHPNTEEEIGYYISENKFLINDFAVKLNAKSNTWYIPLGFNYWGSPEGPGFNQQNRISEQLEVYEYYIDENFEKTNMTSIFFNANIHGFVHTPQYLMDVGHYESIRYPVLRGEEVIFVAEPKIGYEFIGWADSEGNVTNKDPFLTVKADEDQTLYPFFKQLPEEEIGEYHQSPSEENIKEGKVEVDLSTEQANKITQLISKNLLVRLQKNEGTINLSKEEVQLEIPAEVFSKVGYKDTVSVTLEKITPEKDADKAMSDVYSFSLKGQDGQSISEFADTPIKLKFKVYDHFKGNTDLLKVKYYNPETEKWELIGGEHEDGYVVAETTHFSTFGVFEVTAEEVEEETGESEEESNEDTDNEQTGTEDESTSGSDDESSEENTDDESIEEGATSDEDSVESNDEEETATNKSNEETTEEVTKEVKSTKKVDSDNEESETSVEKLPETATNIYGFGLIGLVILLVGAAFLIYSRKRA
ncbi:MULTISPECIES: nitrous oxide reductase family maturation protein NosD [Allobacillus]|uniref:LPXTG cell wall anchor domain-containing protein n=1 Tax=Allobacillus salarius TaxID=1955272 RepID=A0A556PMT2_9BACI|nr:LPXTG cell wall anchor domain-containing protein [Allobacillus salarius]TSJ65706.1 LPXTG cell wall anchor domain-containing protein [Allobacillus salarius]